MNNPIKNRLVEVDYLRCFLVITLVLYHAYAPFCGAWSFPLLTEQPLPMNFWLAKFLYGGMLETFVLISGYIYAFSTRNHEISLRRLIRKKFFRLYMPAIIWGSLWLFLFSTCRLDIHTLLRVLSGSGHLWFLPMLFWCFIFEFFLGKYITKKYLLFGVLFAIPPYPTIPIIKLSLFYCFFFHLGYLLFVEKEFFLSFIRKIKFSHAVLSYICIFLLTTYIEINYLCVNDTTPLLQKATLISISNAFRLIRSIWVVYLYYVMSIFMLRYYHGWKRIVIQFIANYSFGIYIFQEFVIRFIYYKTDFCHELGQYWFPIVAFIIAFIVSLLLSYLFSNFSVTRKLLG